MAVQFISRSSLVTWTEKNIKAVPEKPGVFVLRSADQKIGYIASAGKGRLRARLLEHWKQNDQPKTEYFDWYATATEKDAREAELALITQQNPPWNKK